MRDCLLVKPINIEAAERGKKSLVFFPLIYFFNNVRRITYSWFDFACLYS